MLLLKIENQSANLLVKLSNCKRTAVKTLYVLFLFENVHSLNNIFLTDSVDKKVHVLMMFFIKCLDMFAPTVKVVKRPSTPWMNGDLLKAIESRNETQCKFNTDKQNTFLQQEYKMAKSYVKTLMDQTEAEYYYNHIVNCRRTASTWKDIKEIVPIQNKTSNTYNVDDLCDKAEKFNNFFSRIGEKTYKRSQEVWDT